MIYKNGAASESGTGSQDENIMVCDANTNMMFKNDSVSQSDTVSQDKTTVCYVNANMIYKNDADSQCDTVSWDENIVCDVENEDGVVRCCKDIVQEFYNVNNVLEFVNIHLDCREEIIKVASNNLESSTKGVEELPAGYLISPPTSPMCYQNNESDEELLTNEIDSPSSPKFRINQFVNKPKGILEFTGLEDYYKFETVYLSLGKPSVFNKLKYESNVGFGKLSLMDQMFITIWKLRKNATDMELSLYLDIHEKQVGNIFRTWIQFMAKRWSKIDLWPSKELIQFYMPENFKKDFPNTRVIIDGTEIYTQRSKNPVVQQAAFSFYKNDTTLKALVGNSPGGLITFHSDLFGGSTSDRQVVERSGLQNKCQAGDMVMADRRIAVQDMFASYDVTVKTPHFTRGKGYLPFNHVISDRNLAKFRVHVERVIGVVKTYKILATE